MPASLREKGTEDTQVIRSMQRTKEVSLLRLGVTGIISKENKSHFFNMEIPGTERARFIQYTFDAKLGFEGKDVVIKKTDGNTLIAFQMLVSASSPASVGFDYMLMPRTRVRS